MTSFIIPRDHDFTFPDYESIFSRLGTAIDSVLSAWTNRLRASFENVILGNQCFTFDIVMGYIEQRIRETRLATVINRATSVRLSRLHHNYRPIENAAATATVALDIGETTPGSVPIPAGTVIFTAGPNRVSGQVLVTATIAAGSTTVDVSWEESETIPFSFVGTGLPRQRFPLAQAPYLWQSTALSDTGDDWIEIEHFTDYGPDDKVFRVEVDENGFADATFGNGVYGAKPAGPMTGTYKVGGGLDGNVAADSLTRVSGIFTDTLGNPVTLSATNDEAATGGAGKESVELIRLKAPAAGKAQERSVARPDMETNAERVTSVARVLVLTSAEDVGLPENTGHIYAVGFGTTTNSGKFRPLAATSTDKAAVVTNLTVTYPVPATFEIITQDTLFDEVNFQITIGVADGFTFASVAQDIYDALDDFFAVSDSEADGKGPNLNMDFGYELGGKLQWHRLFNAVIDTEGVDDIDEDSFVPPNDPVIRSAAWTKIGTVRITDADTGSFLDF